MKAKLAIVGVFLVAIILILAKTMGGTSKTGDAADATDAGGAAKPDPAAGAVEISMLYSTEKKEWIEAVALGFKKEHPEIKVTLIGKGSISGAEGIVDDKDKPTIFSPADTMVLNLASSDWKTKGRGDLFSVQGDDVPQSLVITPIVWVVWQDRADVLLKAAKGQITLEDASTGTFMTDMVRFGPSKYDISVVYENLAISQIENAQGRWGDLRVYYPQTTLWSDHPAAILAADWVTPGQRQAARTWLAYLRSRPVQERALAFGFRPGDPSVPVRSADAQNPWSRLTPYGIQVDIPPVAKTPEGAIARNLMTMWSRIVGSEAR